MSKNQIARSTIGLILVAVVLAGCSRRDAGTGDTGIAIGADTGVTAVGATGAAAAPAGQLSDANIVFILDHANMLDSAAGSIAATKGTSSEVREYGSMMMRDHHSLRQQGQELATKLGVTPVPPANDNSQEQTDRTMALLNGAAKGRDFDKAYIDNEVTYHKAVLETATAAMAAAQNAELKNLIQKAAPAIQAHLDRAQAIQSKMQ